MASKKRTPPGRAVTIEQKREVIKDILAGWRQHPELRLGQFLFNAMYYCGADLFYVEDDAMALEALKYDV